MDSDQKHEFEYLKNQLKFDTLKSYYQRDPANGIARFFDQVGSNDNADLIFGFMTICSHQVVFPEEYATIKTALEAVD